MRAFLLDFVAVCDDGVCKNFPFVVPIFKDWDQNILKDKILWTIGLANGFTTQNNPGVFKKYDYYQKSVFSPFVILS